MEEERIIPGADDHDPVEDERQERIMDYEEQQAIAYLTRLGYEIKRITKYDE